MPIVITVYATQIIGRYFPAFDMINPATTDIMEAPSEKGSILCTQRQLTEGEARVQYILDSSTGSRCSKYYRKSVLLV